jgi:carbamoyltransferase
MRECEHRRDYADDGVTLGVTLMGHDVSCTLLDHSGVPIIVAEEERYSRQKKGRFIPPSDFPVEVVREVGLCEADIRHVALANIPELFDRRALVSRSGEPFARSLTTHALYRVLSRRLPDLDSVTWVRHHLCHAASAFFASPFSDAVVLTVDGMGEDETASIWDGEGERIEKRIAVRHPHSLGYLYQAIAQWIGLTGGEREGKLMGLCAFGEPNFTALLRKNFLHSDGDGAFRLAPALAAIRCDNANWVQYCESYLGPRRRPGEPLTAKHRDVAASVQLLLEETLLAFAQLANRLTGRRRACFAGGVFMNSVANGRLRREAPFDDIWVQPLAGDNGLSLGAALWTYTSRHRRRPHWWMSSPFLGSDIRNDEVRALVAREHACVEPYVDLEQEVASLLAAGKFVGWVRGRAEVGARALGHRSIFADPRIASTKDRLNEVIKRREPWRPFAPIALEEEAGRFFLDARPSPLMTFCSQARSNAGMIPAVLHVDGTARVQTVGDDFDPSIVRLLRAFRETTGIGVLLNTSFNVRGEPIVRTPDDAWRIFNGTGMDALVLGDYLLRKLPEAVWSGKPVEAAPRRIRFASNAVEALCRAQRAAVIALGTLEAAAELRRHLGGAPVAWHNSPRPSSFAHLLVLDHVHPEGARVPLPIETLASCDVVVLLSPTWVEVAETLVPNLLAPFAEVAACHPAVDFRLVDEDGGERRLDRFTASRTAAATEAEEFWLCRPLEWVDDGRWPCCS